MTKKLPVETLCLVFKELIGQEDLKSIKTLFSCLLVNRLWCQAAVPILWRDPWKLFTIWCDYQHQTRYRALFRTLTLFLTDNALEQLRKFGIDHLKDPPKYSFRSNPRRKAVFSISPLFNYPSFCKNLSTYHINDMMNHVRTRKYGSYKFILIKE